jgi:hypothetical protein
VAAAVATEAADSTKSSRLPKFLKTLEVFFN